VREVALLAPSKNLGFRSLCIYFDQRQRFGLGASADYFIEPTVLAKNVSPVETPRGKRSRGSAANS